MVKKLFKYEFIHYIRALLPFELMVLIVALFSRIIQLFDNGSTTYNIIFYSSVIMYVIGIVLCLVMCFVTAITRYYKNLFTAEGYLTMTLPVTENQHILVKWITGFLSVVVSVLNILISVVIITFGEPLSEILKAISYLYKRCFQSSGFDTVFVTAEVLILALLAVLYMLMMFYSCITIGQLAKKNRILAAFGVYFGYYVFNQIMGTVFLILMMTTNLMDFISNMLSGLREVEVFHLIFGVSGALSIGLTAVFYVVCKKIIRSRLNLE